MIAPNMRIEAVLIAGFALLSHAHPRHLTVDLGYEKYTGIHNDSTDLNIWKGIRYAAPPIGNLRFSAPTEPEHTGQTVLADTFGSACLQTLAAGGSIPPWPPLGAEEDQDCLFLNVYAPSGAKKLPVYVWIHGGGYGQADGSYDFTEFINANGNEFLAVSMNYRLGAFGFLSSEDVKKDGALNAGLLDQRFSLEWIQKNIHLFGGDKSRVTIHGVSAGGGSVMLQSMANGGTDGDKLFDKGMSSSPYLPRHYKYDDDFPTSLYDQFVTSAGCEGDSDKLSCLRSKDIEVLQEANVNVTNAAAYGTWAFAPVTDGSFIQNAPSTQLLDKKAVNGNHMWASHNADEGPLFVPRNITTEKALVDFLRTSFPRFDDDDIASLLEMYPLSAYGKDTSNPLFATAGDSGPTAVDVSPFAIGHQQRADAIYAEATFQCPSYWVATGYTGDEAKSSYLFTYTNPPALHGADISGYLGPAIATQSADFVRAWRSMWGAYIATGSPNIPSDVANNPDSDVLSNWPRWGNNLMVNFNQTGGTPARADAGFGFGEIAVNVEPGLENAFREADARTWEGGRGKRCDFWKQMAPKVPM
ncbi:hypothetical protein SLS64_008801 [Diaporthe eres]